MAKYISRIFHSEKHFSSFLCQAANYSFISLKNIRTPCRFETGNATQVPVRKLGRLKADALSSGANLVINKYPDRAAYRATPFTSDRSEDQADHDLATAGRFKIPTTATRLKLCKKARELVAKSRSHGEAEGRGDEGERRSPPPPPAIVIRIASRAGRSLIFP